MKKHVENGSFGNFLASISLRTTRITAVTVAELSCKTSLLKAEKRTASNTTWLKIFWKTLLASCRRMILCSVAIDFFQERKAHHWTKLGYGFFSPLKFTHSREAGFWRASCSRRGIAETELPVPMEWATDRTIKAMKNSMLGVIIQGPLGGRNKPLLGHF